MEKEWLLRDPVHGFIEPSNKEMAIIDTPCFQRLRGIKQLANTHLVFPGATHTRFEHCIGTMHVASKMADRIESLDDNIKRIIRLSALLHDIGHGPFSHISESIISRVINDPNFKNICICRDALTLDEDIRKALGPDIDAVLDLLNTENKTSVEYDIIDGPIDADKYDYLNRDGYYTGVPYGNADTLRVLHTLTEIQEGRSGRSYLGVSTKGIEAVQSVFLARYYMLQVVHNHKTRKSADLMLIRSAFTGMKEDNSLDENYYAYKTADADFLGKFFNLDDMKLLRILTEGAGISKDLAMRLQKRKLFKCANAIEIEELKGIARMKFSDIDQESALKIETEIAEEAQLDPHYVIIDVQGIENPLYREPIGESIGMIKQVLIQSDSGILSLDEMPGPWSSETKKFVRISVFCPEENRDRVKSISDTIIHGE